MYFYTARLDLYHIIVHMISERHVRLKINGRVQGVYFRKSAQSWAEQLNLRGIAENLSDGSLLIEVEGEPSKVKEFIERCEHGPRNAKVESVDIKELNIAADFKGFSMG